MWLRNVEGEGQGEAGGARLREVLELVGADLAGGAMGFIVGANFSRTCGVCCCLEYIGGREGCEG